MNPQTIKKLLSEQPDSYLHHKDLNTFNTADLHCLRKGILKEQGSKPTAKTSTGKRQPFKIIVTFDGKTEEFRYRHQVMRRYSVTKGIVQYGIDHGFASKGTLKFETVLINEDDEE